MTCNETTIGLLGAEQWLEASSNAVYGGEADLSLVRHAPTTHSHHAHRLESLVHTFSHSLT